MAKKRDKSVDTSSARELTHNPFAALAGVRAPSSPDPASSQPPEPSEPESPRGARFEAKVVVRRERAGRGGKTITRVSGIASGDREAVMRDLRRALGCGAALEGDDVILTGSLVDRAADWLAQQGAKRISRSR